MTAAAIVTVRAFSRPNTNTDSGPRTKALKRLEASRVARLKRAGQSIMHTLKQADKQAREMFVQDLQDVTETATEVLLRADTPATTE